MLIKGNKMKSLIATIAVVALLSNAAFAQTPATAPAKDKEATKPVATDKADVKNGKMSDKEHAEKMAEKKDKPVKNDAKKDAAKKTDAKPAVATDNKESTK